MFETAFSFTFIAHLMTPLYVKRKKNPLVNTEFVNNSLEIKNELDIT